MFYPVSPNIFCAFIEDKLHLGINLQTSLSYLHSICIIFIEDKLHLGKFIQTSLMSLHSICIIFVKKRMIERIAGHRGYSRFPQFLFIVMFGLHEK